LYLRNVPAKAPTANNMNSIPFIFLFYLPNFSWILVGIISFQDRSGFGFYPKANAIAYFGRITLEYLNTVNYPSDWTLDKDTSEHYTIAHLVSPHDEASPTAARIKIHARIH
jgi:hypothetical protein